MGRDIALAVHFQQLQHPIYRVVPPPAIGAGPWKPSLHHPSQLLDHG
jgi:hypothetical protein